MIRSALLVLTLLTNFFLVSAQTLVPLTSGKETSIRGLSVVNDKVAWISGSNGYLARTADAGRHWEWYQPKGYEQLDFRDIEAFSAEKAIAVNAGSPAVILLTEDGGRQWKEVYRNNSKDIFLDGMDFWGEDRGIIYGDPLDGKMQLLQTLDGGRSWTNISGNLKFSLLEGEASFAASGTTIRTLGKGKCWIATGGKRSRIFYSEDYGKTWRVTDCPIVQGESSTGPFSLAFWDEKVGVACGGNYLQDTVRAQNLVLTTDGGKTWTTPRTHPFGYRSSVEFRDRNVLIATGTSGTDSSTDGGKTWQKVSSTGYHVVRKAKHGSLVLLAGSNGRVAFLAN